jgi:tetratricopeptide (TPR) repeat protein
LQKQRAFLVALLLFFQISGSADIDTADLQRAVTLYKEKNYHDAYSMLRTLQRQDLRNEQVNYLIGRLAYLFGDYDRALFAYKRVLLVNPHHYRTIYEMGRTYLLEDNPSHAYQAFQTVIEQSQNKTLVKYATEYNEGSRYAQRSLVERGLEDFSGSQQSYQVKTTTQQKQPINLHKDMYEKALRLYNKGEYEKAYVIFYNLIDLDIVNKHYNYYLGRSAYHLQKYNEAIAAYERILTNYPDNLRSKLELAKTYMAAKEFQQAKQLFKALQKETLTAQVHGEIDGYLKQIEQSRPRHSLHGAVVVGATYDSNVHNRPDSETFAIPTGPTLEQFVSLTNTTKDEADSAHTQAVILNHKYDLRDKYGITLRNDVVGFNRGMDKNSDKDVQYVSYAPGVIIHREDYEYDIGLQADQMWYGDEKFLHTLSVVPSIKSRGSDGTLYTGSVKYQKKKYDQKDYKNRDATYLEFSAKGEKRMSERLRSTTGFAIERERKDGGVLTNVDYNAYRFDAKADYQVADKWVVGAGATYKMLRYQDRDAIEYKKQKDDMLKASVNLTHTVADGYMVQTGVGYIYNDSNFDSARYKKKTANMNLIKSF